MSISMEFVLDEDGIASKSSIKNSSSQFLTDENEDLDQIFENEIQERKFRTQMALRETFENFRNHTDMHNREISEILSPLSRVALEHDEYVQKMFESFQKASEVTRRKWEDERKERDCETERESKFSNYLLFQRCIFSVEQLDEEFQIADKNRDACYTHKELSEFYKRRFHMYFQKFSDQKNDFERCQKKCAELEARNRQLMKKLKKGEAKVQNANFHQKENNNVSRKRPNSDSVKSDEELQDSKTVELIKKLCFPFFGSKNNGAKAAKKVPDGMKSEEKLCDHRVESDLLNNGQGCAEVKNKEESTEGLVDESGYIGYDCYNGYNSFNGYNGYNGYSSEESAKGIAEDSGIVLLKGEKSSDEVHRSLSGFQSQQSVRRKKKEVQGVIKGFEVLSKCQKEFKKQYCKVIEESKSSNSFEDQSVVKEPIVLLSSVHSSSMLPESTCQEDSKYYESELVSKVTSESIAYVELDDHISEASVLCDTNDLDMVEVLKEEAAKGTAVKSSNLVSQKYIEDTSGSESSGFKSSEVENSELSQNVCRTKIPMVIRQESSQKYEKVPETVKSFKDQDVVHCGLVVRTEDSNHFKMTGLQKHGDVACGVVLQKKTKRRKQEESRPRTDPPDSTISSGIQNDETLKSDIQDTSISCEQSRQDCASDILVSTKSREMLFQKEKSSSTDGWSDDDSIRVKEKPHPGKDPPTVMDYKENQFGHMLQEFRPRKDPPISWQLQYGRWSPMEFLNMPSTTTWNQFAIVVH